MQVVQITEMGHLSRGVSKVSRPSLPVMSNLNVTSRRTSCRESLLVQEFSDDDDEEDDDDDDSLSLEERVRTTNGANLRPTTINRKADAYFL